MQLTLNSIAPELETDNLKSGKFTNLCLEICRQEQVDSKFVPVQNMPPSPLLVFFSFFAVRTDGS